MKSQLIKKLQAHELARDYWSLHTLKTASSLNWKIKSSLDPRRRQLKDKAHYLLTLNRVVTLIEENLRRSSHQWNRISIASISLSSHLDIQVSLRSHRFKIPGNLKLKKLVPLLPEKFLILLSILKRHIRK